jgi:hypothetical protein
MGLSEHDAPNLWIVGPSGTIATMGFGDTIFSEFKVNSQLFLVKHLQDRPYKYDPMKGDFYNACTRFVFFLIVLQHM